LPVDQADHRCANGVGIAPTVDQLCSSTEVAVGIGRPNKQLGSSANQIPPGTIHLGCQIASFTVDIHSDIARHTVDITGKMPLSLAESHANTDDLVALIGQFEEGVLDQERID